SWDVFPFIINRERSGLLVNAGFEPVTSAGPRDRLAMLNQLQADTTPYVEGVRHDSFTVAAAREYLRAARPRVLYLSLDETGERADTDPVTQAQVAATVAAALGEDYAGSVAGVARPIAAALARDAQAPATRPAIKESPAMASSSDRTLDRARLLQWLGDTPPS